MKTVSVLIALSTAIDQHVHISDRDQGDERRGAEGGFCAAHAEIRATEREQGSVCLRRADRLAREDLGGRKSRCAGDAGAHARWFKEGKLCANSKSTFGTVSISVVVKQGASQPDISTKEKFREAMLSARSIVHATPGKTPSGTHMGKVMEQLGIAEAVAKKIVHRPALEGGVQLVAEGQADIGIYPASEVANVRGVTIVGSLAAGIELNILYGGAAMADSPAGEAAAAFVKFMAAPENRSVWKHAGFEPPG
jgi:hypothetical protein